MWRNGGVELGLARVRRTLVPMPAARKASPWGREGDGGSGSGVQYLSDALTPGQSPANAVAGHMCPARLGSSWAHCGFRSAVTPTSGRRCSTGFPSWS